jgi:hypothetical protein
MMSCLWSHVLRRRESKHDQITLDEGDETRLEGGRSRERERGGEGRGEERRELVEAEREKERSGHGWQEEKRGRVM